MSYLAEQNIIGSLLMDSECIEKISHIVSAEMFQSEVFGRIYTEYLRGYDNRYLVNMTVLMQKLENCNIPQDAVQEEIRACMANTFSSVEIVSYAKVVADEHKARCLERILAGQKPVADGVEGQIGKLIGELEALQEGQKATSKTLSQIARENKGKYFVDNETSKIYLGFPKLDELLGGLEGGDMIVIGARPAVGKSAFVTQVTSNLARQGKRVGFYNLEMQEKQVYERFVAAQSGIELTRLRRAKQFLGDEKERFDKANNALERQDNIVLSTGSKAMSEIRSESRHMGYDVIIIDYLQLLRADKTYRGNRYAEVGAIAKAIKALAMELNIPVIALSQLNRVSELKETREPTMAELREAGDIEQNASVIMLMWNLSDEDRRKKGFKVEKQRQGNTGKIVLDFNGALMRFEESDEDVKTAQEWAQKQDNDCPFR